MCSVRVVLGADRESEGKEEGETEEESEIGTEEDGGGVFFVCVFCCFVSASILCVFVCRCCQISLFVFLSASALPCVLIVVCFL